MEKEKVIGLFKSKLVENEKLTFLGEQIRPWRFRDKFCAVFLFVLMIYILISFILPIPFIDAGFIREDIVAYSILIFIPELILIILFVKNRPLRNFKNKEPKWYYAFTSYSRVMFYRRKMLLGDAVYWYDLKDASMCYEKIDNIPNYNFKLSFRQPDNDNFEWGTTYGYTIYLKTRNVTSEMELLTDEEFNSFNRY